MSSRAPGYGGEGPAIRKGAAMLRASEYGDQGDRLNFVIPGTRVTSGRGQLVGRSFVPEYVVTDPDSEARPACMDVDPETFFPAPGDKKTADYAKAVCRSCPVRPRCQDQGDGNTFGVWGGLTEQERRREQRRGLRRTDVARLVHIQQARRSRA